MDTLTHLTAIITELQGQAILIGGALASLMIGIYTMAIMIKHDKSPTAQATRWDDLHKVLICAAILAGSGAFIQFATGIGGKL